jgi:hypothetical protein
VEPLLLLLLLLLLLFPLNRKKRFFSHCLNRSHTVPFFTLFLIFATRTLKLSTEVRSVVLINMRTDSQGFFSAGLSFPGIPSARPNDAAAEAAAASNYYSSYNKSSCEINIISRHDSDGWA